MSLSPTTELEAVNVLLAAINEPPVNSLTGSLPIDASIARSTLAEISREVQSRGWWFNVEVFTLTPDNSQNIVIPTNSLRVKPVDDDAQDKYVVRQGKLYDKTKGKNTYTITEDVDVEVTQYLAFEDLPEVARRYITVRAARVYQERQLSSPQLYKYDISDEQAAHTLMRQEETDTAKWTIKSSQSMSRILDRRYAWRY